MSPTLSYPQPQDEPDLSGQQLGPWRLERMLGEGGMGRVYVARHDRIHRLAAVKVLRREHVGNLDLVHRFMQEAQAVNAIRNEHIVEVFDFGELAREGQPPLIYCVMELLEGEALSQTLNHGPLRLNRVAHIGAQLGLALHAAHRVGVVHRDIKPENIMLTRRGDDPDFVKVLDFGVAKLLTPLGEVPLTGTQAGLVVGTPEYMAPEQALGRTTDLRSDLYAVGLVLYELATGYQPFKADTFGELVVAMTQQPVPPLPTVTMLGELMPPGLGDVILRLLAKEPAARFQNGEDLALALEPYTRPLGPDVELPPRPVRLTWEMEVDVDVVEPPPPARRRGVRTLGALAAVTLLGSAAWLGWHVPPVPMPGPLPVRLEVATAPPGAVVTRADTGERLGVTPLELHVPPAGATTLTFTLTGHAPATRAVDLSSNSTLWVDLRPLERVEAQSGARNPAAAQGPAPAGAGGKRRGDRKHPERRKVGPDGTLDPFTQ